MNGELLRYNKQIKYVILDCETFNLNLSFQFNRPWQVALLKLQGDQIIEEKDVHINWANVAPHLKIGDDAARQTHYNHEKEIKLGIEPDEAFVKFWDDLIWADYIIMHNGLRFDIYILKGYAEYMGVPWKFLVNKVIDTNSVAKGIKLNIPYTGKQGTFIDYQYRMSNTIAKGVKTGLKALCNEFGLSYEENLAHDGVYDCYRNREVWDKLKYQIEI